MPAGKRCSFGFLGHPTLFTNRLRQRGVLQSQVGVQHNVHLTVFGAGGRDTIPLQLPLFADDLSATIGGK